MGSEAGLARATPATVDGGPDGRMQEAHLDFVTWFGLPGHALVRTDNWHVVRVGPMALPHPGLVNRFLREPDEPEEWLRLVGLHERGHFETLPIAVLLFCGLCRSRSRRCSGISALVLADLTFLHVVWEGLAEGWVIKETGREYRWPSTRKTAGFWLSVAASCLWVLGRGLRRRVS